MDKYTKDKRSEIMSKIRGKWTTPEKRIHGLLKGKKIKHRMHPKMPGSPDIILSGRKVAVFIDGCFWHGCPRCYRKPASNRKFWEEKVVTNRKRDRRDTLTLRDNGWKVIRLWEHEIKGDTQACLEKVLKSRIND